MLQQQIEGTMEVLLVEDNPGDIRLTEEAFKEASLDCNLHVVEDGVETAVSTDTESTTTPVQSAPIDASVEELISAADAHFEAAQAAQRDGDWATYGAELEALEETLNRLLELTSATP